MSFVHESLAILRDAHKFRFKVGDRVRVKADDEFYPCMEVVIVEFRPQNGGYIARTDDGQQGGFGDVELEPVPGPCEGCGETENVQWEPSRTCYDRKPGKPDPNAPVALCRSCAEEHHEHSDDLW